MDLLQLRYFLAVAELQNITLAAKRLYISQPALSNAISRLEKDIGVTLFRRGSNSIALTEAGSCFLEYVNSALSDLNEGISRAKQIANKSSDCLRIASSFGMVSEIVEEYCKKHKDQKIELKICDTDRIITMLLNKETDLALNMGPISDSRFSNRVLLESRYFVFLNKENPLAQKSSVTLQDLENQLLFCSRIAHTYEAAQTIFSRAGLSCNIFKLDERKVLFESARRGLGGVFCMPMLSNENRVFSDNAMENLVHLPIADCSDKGQVVLVTRKDLYISAEMEKFIYDMSLKFYSIGETTKRELISRGLDPD